MNQASGADPAADPYAGDRFRSLHQELIRFQRSVHLAKQSFGTALPDNGGVAVLAQLTKRGGPMRSSDLAGCTALDPSTVSRQVDSLVRTGAIVRTADPPSDGRATLLEITPAGREKFAAHTGQIAALLTELLGGGWTSEQVEALITSLSHLNDDLTRLPDLLQELRDSGTITHR